MSNKEDTIINEFINKSTEAFIVGIELYNKPTINYRTEGFSFFICNSWELMLKAYLLKQNKSIYYNDNKNRTLSLSDCVKLVYTDKNTRIRQNLEKIIDLRNISTHYITQDYEIKYAPLFQACVINYVKELYRFHKVDITKKLSQNFLTICASIEPLTNEEIKIKYPARIAEKLIEKSNEIALLTKEYNSDKFAINIKQNLYITRKKDEADFLVKFDKESNNRVTKIKELKDPANTHPYTHDTVISVVQDRMNKLGITIDYKKGYNSYVQKLFFNFYNIKSNSTYCYKHKLGNHDQCTYSQQLVDFIIKCIKESKGKFVESLKDGWGNKKDNPRHIGIAQSFIKRPTPLWDPVLLLLKLSWLYYSKFNI